MKLTYCLCLVNHTGIVVVHSIDICPDLDFISTNGSTDERCGIVGSSTVKVVNLTIGITTDEALCDINLIAVGFLQDLGQLLFDVVGIRLGILVGSHEVKGREQNGVDALLLKIVHDHVS